MHAALFIAVLGTVPATAYFEANPKIIEGVPIYNYDLARLARAGNSPHNHVAFLEMMQQGGNAPEDEDDIEWIIEMKDGASDKEVDAVCKDKAAHGCLSEGHPDKHGIPVAGVKATILGLTKLLAAHKGEVKHVEPNLPIYLPPNEADHIVVESEKKTKKILEKHEEEEEGALMQINDGKAPEYYVMRHIMSDFVVGERHSSMNGADARFSTFTKEGLPCVIVNEKFHVLRHFGKNSPEIMKDFRKWWMDQTGRKPESGPAPTKAPPATRPPAPGKEPEDEDEGSGGGGNAPVDKDTRRRRISTTTDAWGLDRIDAETGLDHHYESTYDGKGVHVYVLDTGIKHDHTDFLPAGETESHAETTLEMWGSSVMPCTSKDDVTCAVDRFGHGTHCAGSVGGEYSGVAKGATIHGVKVLGDDGKGSDLGVAMAIDWIMTNGKRPAILSMSLGRRGKSATMADVLDKAIDGGLTVVVAAGNEAMDACGNSPAFVEKVITVAAATPDDSKADFSNYGSCVDIFAPGKSIRSAYFAGAARFATMSGTSMACPHVSGFAALVLQANPTLKPAQVKEILLKDAIKDKMLSAGPRSPDLMLHVQKNPSWGQEGGAGEGPALQTPRRRKPSGGSGGEGKRRRRGKGASAESGSKRRRRGGRRRRRRRKAAAPAPPA